MPFPFPSVLVKGRCLDTRYVEKTSCVLIGGSNTKPGFTEWQPSESTVLKPIQFHKGKSRLPDSLSRTSGFSVKMSPSSPNAFMIFCLVSAETLVRCSLSEVGEAFQSSHPHLHIPARPEHRFLSRWWHWDDTDFTAWLTQQTGAWITTCSAHV